MFETSKRTKTEHTLGCPKDNAIKSNFEKLYKWLNGQTKLFTVIEIHATMCSFAEKDLNVLFTMVEKAVTTTLPEFKFFHIWSKPFEHSLFYGYGKYHIIKGETGKKTLMMKKWELLLPPQI